MFQLLWGLVELVINKYSAYRSQKSSDALEREKILAETEQTKDKWKAVILTSTGSWWFQLFFVIPLAVWFSFVIIYSMIWCEDCIWPQPWTVAALPSPLNDWAGAIIAFLFLTNAPKR